MKLFTGLLLSIAALAPYIMAQKSQAELGLQERTTTMTNTNTNPQLETYEAVNQLYQETMYQSDNVFPADDDNLYNQPTLIDLYLYKFDPMTGMEIINEDLPKRKFNLVGLELAIFDDFFKFKN